MRLSDDFIQQVKERNYIVDIVSSYVTLKRAGKLYKGLCPFHGEKTPSFVIYPEEGSFYCFGCNTGGDVISFIMKIENLDYLEAVKYLADRAGLSMPEDDFDDSTTKLRKRIYEANREAARFYYKQLFLDEGHNALKYLLDRGLKKETITHFGLGYAPQSRFALVNYLKSIGFRESEMVAANLANNTKSGRGVIDRYDNRVMFPIVDVRGNVIGFGGRKLSPEQKAKYINTSDTMVFNKSKNLYSLNNAKNSGSSEYMLCEGYMDVIAVNQAGVTNAVATLGTALTQDQALLMKRYCESVVICYDADEAGQNATQRAIPILRSVGLSVRVLNIPDGKDPDEFIKKHGDQGPAAFRKLIQSSGNDIEYRLLKVSLKNDINTTQGKISYLNDATKILATLDNSMERDLYASKLAQEVNVSKESIVEQVNKIRRLSIKGSQKEEFKKITNQSFGRNDKVNAEHAKELRATKAEEMLISFLVRSPNNLNYVLSKISNEDFVTIFNKKLFEYFVNRIKENKEATTLISADFTDDEVSKIVSILNGYKTEPLTKEAVDSYISTIKEEKTKPTKQQIANSSNEDFEKLIKSRADSKK